MKGEPDGTSETAQGLAPDPRSARVSSTVCPPSLGAGRYHILRLLGGGGQKQVYLARDNRLGRDVVIALLKAHQLEDKGGARLRREAHAMAQLGEHPNIVTIYDLGEEEGRPYIVSQYIDGGSVEDLLRRENKHPLALKTCLRITEQVCQALAHAHNRGIVHRDLKPANIWMTKDGSVKLGDFGIALDPGLRRLTEQGMMVGTVTYMAPEQALGHEAEPRSDLYSLGVMLYEMVTGRPPFLGDQLVGIVSQHINTPPVSPSWHNPELPQTLEALILRLLAKTPDQRPESAASVGKALAAIADLTTAASEPVGPQDSTSLARLAVGVFVGREQEISMLRVGLNDALAGRGSLLMLAGEPGSGKTRTAEQLATYARMRGAQVLVGCCFEGEGAPAFWPWVQIIRSYVRDRQPEELATVMSTGTANIGQLVSDVRDRFPNLPSPLPLEPEQARFRLFDSVTHFLKNAAKSQPLVLILDDLHWADKPSLLLLRFLARELPGSRLLIVGTYRDVDLGRQHPLAQTLAELARLGLSERIVLRGLSKTDVTRFIEMTASLDPPPALVEAVYNQTEGNPFFVNEVVRLLVSEGRLGRPEEFAFRQSWIPEGVREVVGRRLDHLSKLCNRILTIASVTGRQFSLSVLEPLSELSTDGLLEVLEEATAARVITELPRSVGEYFFSHALIRQTIYDELSATRRVRLHRQIGEILERTYGSKLEPHLAELAYHFLQAAPGGDVDRAVSYAVKAAERATNLMAYEEAVSLYERALEALGPKEHGDEARRLRLLLALGDARRKAGNTTEAREVFRQAADLARKSGAPDQLAHAALGMGAGITGAIGRVDEMHISLLNEALGALRDGDSALRARLLAQLSLAHYYSPDLRAKFSLQAVEMARRVGDPIATIAALYSRHVALVGAEDIEERLAVATESLRIAEVARDKEMALRARYRIILDLLEQGDIPAVDREIEAYARLAEELRQPIYLWRTPFFGASRALMEGRFDEAERLARQARAIGDRVQDKSAILCFQTFMTSLRVAQGRAEEQVAPVKAFLEEFPLIPSRGTLAFLYTQLGRREEARSEFETMAVNNFTDLPHDGSRIVSLYILGYVCYFLHDPQRARTLYQLLLPYARHTVVVGSAPISGGSFSRILALLATTMGQLQEATRHFENAIEMNARTGMKPYLASSQFEYATMLLARGQPGDREKAMALCNEALSTARELGMKKLAEGAEALSCTN